MSIDDTYVFAHSNGHETEYIDIVRAEGDDADRVCRSKAAFSRISTVAPLTAAW
jgi:hypothetical protein